MAIDPGIALGVRPAQIDLQLPNPVQQYATVMSLRDMMTRQQMGQMQLQEAGLQLQRAQQEQRERQAIANWYQSQTAPDPGAPGGAQPWELTPAKIAQLHAIAPNLAPGLIKQNLDTTEAFYKGQHEKATAAQDQLTRAGAIARGINDEASKLSAVGQLFGEGLINGQQRDYFNGLQYDSPQFQQALKGFQQQALTADQALTQQREAAELKIRQAAENRSAALAGPQLAKAQAESLAAQLGVAAQTVPNNQSDWDAWRAGLPVEVQRRVPTMYSPAAQGLVQQLGMTAAQQATATREQAAAAALERHKLTEEAQGRRRIGLQSREQNLREKQFDMTYGALLDADGKPLSPDAMKAVAVQDPVAVAISNYQAAPPPSATRGGMPSPLMRKVMAINPDYNAMNWTQQKDTLLAFSPAGKIGAGMNKMGTALGHLGVLDEATEALKNTNVPVLNRIANSIGVATGSDATTVFRTIVHRLGPEIEGAYVAGGGTGGERGTTEADFDPNKGYQQIKSNIGVSAKLFRSKIAENEYQWQQVMGKRPMPSLLSPHAEAAMQRITGATAEGNKPTTYKNTAVGPNGHRIGTNDNGATWYDVETGKKI